MSVRTITRLLEHMLWADDRVAESISRQPAASRQAWDLYAHILGAEQVWLARIAGAPQGDVWPDPDPDALDELRRTVQQEYVALVRELDDEGLRESIAYTNSAGNDFESTVSDILHHVFLHGSYHRAQVALLMRAAGGEPATTDYIAFVRGSAAATRDDVRAREER